MSTLGLFPYGTSSRDHVPEHVWDPPKSVPAVLPAVEELDDMHEAAFLICQIFILYIMFYMFYIDNSEEPEN